MDGLFDPHEGLVFLNGVTDSNLHFGDLAGSGSEDEGIHLHRFESEQVVSFLHRLPGTDDDGSDAAGERARDIPRTGWTSRGGGRSGSCRGCRGSGSGCWSRRSGGSSGRGSGCRDDSGGGCAADELIRHFNGDVISDAINCDPKFLNHGRCLNSANFMGLEDLGSAFERPDVEVRHRRRHFLNGHQPERLAEHHGDGSANGSHGFSSNPASSVGLSEAQVSLASGLQAGDRAAECALDVIGSGGILQAGQEPVNDDQGLAEVGLSGQQVVRSGGAG